MHQSIHFRHFSMQHPRYVPLTVLSKIASSLNKIGTECEYSLWHPDGESPKCSSSHLSHLAPPIPERHSHLPEMGSQSSDMDPIGSQEQATQPAVKFPKPGCKICWIMQNQLTLWSSSFLDILKTNQVHKK